MGKLFDTPVKAIRKKCLDCCAGSRKEVRECTVIKCAIYAYRFGKRPDQAVVGMLKQYYSEEA